MDYEHDDQQGLDASERPWVGPEGGPYALIPSSRRRSVFVTGEQRLWNTQLSINALYSNRQFTTDGIALDSSSFIPLSDSATGRADLGWVTVSGSRDLTRIWHADATLLYSGMRQQRDSHEFPAGLTGPSFHSILIADSDIESLQLTADGEAITLPGGPMKVSLGAGVQGESFKTSVLSNPPLLPVAQSPSSLSIYGEQRLPLIGSQVTLSGIKRLELSLAVRFDTYSHFGSTTNPKWSWSWDPISDITIRGTSGTSFKAPQLAHTEKRATRAFLPQPTSSSSALGTQRI